VSVGQIILVMLAGFACGVVNSIAGGGSLLLFPALVATGMGTLAANVTNSVASWPGYVGGVVGFRKELVGQRGRVALLGAATLLGSSVGCILLLSTPSAAFDAVVPFLVAGASLLLAAQPTLKARFSQPGGDAPPLAVAAAAVAVATVYGGYFGGGLGVILLVVLSFTIRDSLVRLNGLKTALSVVDASVSVVIFGLFGPVHWEAVALAAPLTLVGGFVGARVARLIDENVLRWSVAGFGLVVAAALAVT